MPQESKAKQKQAKSGDNVSMPDIVELWKELYFNAEESWSTATRELIASKSFINILDQMRDQYLSFHKISQQNIDQYLEVNPLPSKKDMARIAELIIGLEDKVDNFDLHFYNNISKITSSMIKMVEYQEVMKQEIADLKQQTASINKRLDTINKKLNAKTRSQDKVTEVKSEEDKPVTKPRKSKKRDSES
jgi:polyhydroxyalkanoic acid synthase PhaR subunit